VTAAGQDGERLDRSPVAAHKVSTRLEAIDLWLLVLKGETELVERALAEMDAELGQTIEMRVVHAALRLAQNAPEAAVDVLALIVDDSADSAVVESLMWEIEALLLDAIARDALRDPDGASRSLERALDCAEPDGVLLPFLLNPAPALLERQSRLRSTHASLIFEILNLLSGHAPASRPEEAAPLRDALSESEVRVLRYLTTNLRAPEIAGELFVSLNTIRTHLRHLYAKLGVHSRAEAVKRARELGLLSPSSLHR